MAKKVTGYIKLQIPAGQANPSPPVGPALGQQGVNIMEFCKAFNAQTQALEKGLPTPVVITVYSDRSFTFIMKTPPASVLIAKALGIPKGSATPEHRQGGQDFAQAARGHRQDENAGFDRRQPGCGGAHHCGQRPQHGRRRGGGVTWPAVAKRTKAWKEKLPPGKSYRHR